MEGFESPEGYGAPITLDDVTETHVKDTQDRRRKYTEYRTPSRMKRAYAERREESGGKPLRRRPERVLIQASNAMQPMVLVGVQAANGDDVKHARPPLSGNLTKVRLSVTL